ncbi:hypothetical protein LAWI1_G003348 [Lachnellula willkommii]|uniref:Uncharacterized protein n=1 Tax=Lachnellula willkommii TaxID=215461 RepID=A0A559M7S0_9HELO|nr:hypothetical protein LAWI1_G003348 [Lachnellula willkommii]
MPRFRNLEEQSKVHLKHSATPINDKHRYASHASRASSAPSDPALERELRRGSEGTNQDMHTEISSETHHSVNTDAKR